MAELPVGFLFLESVIPTEIIAGEPASCFFVSLFKTNLLTKVLGQ